MTTVEEAADIAAVNGMRRNNTQQHMVIPAYFVFDAKKQLDLLRKKYSVASNYEHEISKQQARSKLREEIKLCRTVVREANAVVELDW